MATRKKKAKSEDRPITLKDGREMEQFHNSVGILKGNNTLYMRVYAGEAKAEDGTVYELSTNIGGSTPIIRNEKTGLWWTITWQDMIELAIKAGINGPA